RTLRSSPFPYTSLFRSSLMSGSRLSVQMPQEPPIYVSAIVAYWFLKSRFPKHCGFRAGRTTQRPTRRIHEAQSAMACGTIVNLRSEEHTSELQSRFDLV